MKLTKTLSSLFLILLAVIVLTNVVACSEQDLELILSLLEVTPTPLAIGGGTSSGSDWYQVYFTTPIYPDDPANHYGGPDEALAAFIYTAQKSVDIAAYELDLEDVTQALIAAKERGAVVRVVTDIDTLEDKDENPSFKQLQKAGIPIRGGNPSGIMHNKFVVVDEAAVWTGSMNFTDNGAYRNNNNAILIQSSRLAQNYTVTFEKMFLDGEFAGSRKVGGTTPVLSINSIVVENYFSPEGDVAEKLVNRLQRAQTSIDFMAFSFTDDNIGKVLRDRAKAGVSVRGVFETTGSETEYSEYGKLKKAKIDVWQDGNPYIMHHKVFIIDGQTVILGSYNFSSSADKSNDENILIIDDLALAQAFTAEFERVRQQAENPPKK